MSTVHSTKLYCLFALLLLLSFLFGNQMRAQCFEGPVAIVDNNLAIEGKMRFFTIDIDGASASSFEESTIDCIESIELDVQHISLPSTQFFLFNPAGEMVELIGPFTLQRYRTDFATFKITFLPSTDTAEPDAGRSATWNNNFDNWDQFGVYTGSYYPHLDDLEELETGPINGKWTLGILDESVFYTGTLNSFQINFCNPNLNCTACKATAGTYSASAIELCSAYSVLDDIPLPEGILEDMVGYSMIRVFTNTDGDILWVDPDSLTVLSPGTYEQYVVVAQNEDLDEVKQDITMTGNISEVLNKYFSRDLEFCASITFTPQRIILEEPLLSVVDTTACMGQAIVFMDSVFTNPGTYIIAKEGSCDEVFQLNIEESRILPKIIANQTRIECPGDSVILRYERLNSEMNTWYLNEQIIGQGVSIKAGAEGTYVLEVTNNDGCSAQDSLFIEDVSTREILSLSDTLVIDCEHPSVVLDLIVEDSANTQVLWFRNDSRFSDALNPETELEGTYSVTTFSQAGCVEMDSVQVVESMESLSVEVDDQKITCSDSIVIPEVQSNGIIAAYEWYDEQGNVISDSPEVQISEGGNYTLVATDNNGCESTEDFIVTVDTLAPLVFPDEDTVYLRCDGTDVELSYLTSIANLTQQWIYPDGSSSNDPAIVTDQVGEHLLFVESVNGCITRVNYEVFPERIPIITPIDDIYLDCSMPSAVVNVEIAARGANTQWTGPFPVDSSNPEVSVPGPYRVVASTNEGCADTVEFQVFLDTITPEINLIVPDEVPCNNTPYTISTTDSQNYQYSWRTNTGTILSDPNMASIEAQGEGTFYINVLDTTNKCQQMDSILLQSDMSNLDNVTVDKRDESCLDTDDGAVIITGLEQRFTVFIDGNMIDTVDGELDLTLPSGMHQISIEDDVGCVIDRTIDIGPFPIESFSIGEDMLVEEGTAVQFDLLTNGTPVNGLTDQVEWYDNDNLVLSGSSNYGFTVMDENHVIRAVVDYSNICILTDTAVVTILGENNVFIPNVFSPSDEEYEVNKRFKLFFTDGAVNLREFRIYDRWGSVVHEIHNIDPFGYLGWDGTFQGELVNEGVYVYLGFVEFETGEVKRIKGALTFLP